MNDSPSRNMGLHITIGAHPSGKLSLEQELRLLKAALLYGDHVRLYSLTSSMMSMMLRQRDFTSKQQTQLLERVIPYLTSNKDARVLLKFLKEVKKKSQAKHLSRQDRALQTSFQHLLAEQWEAIKQKAIEIATDSGFDEIERAVQAGLLELHTFEGTDNDETVLEFITDCIAGASGSPRVGSRRPEMPQRDKQMIREFVEGVCGAVSDGSTHPLFDEQTGLLVKEQIQEQRITPSESAVGRGKHAGLAGHLLARLPSFDQVSIDEVVDIRRELDKPLTRFRGAVIKFSEQIRSASWDEDFAPDAETVFHRDVKPAVLEIEEAVKSNRYLASLLRKLVDKPLVMPAGSAIALVLSNISSLPCDIAVSIGAGVSALTVVYDAFEEWKQKKQAVERNAMYFYYRAGKWISE